MMTIERQRWATCSTIWGRRRGSVHKFACQASRLRGSLMMSTNQQHLRLRKSAFHTVPHRSYTRCTLRGYLLRLSTWKRFRGAKILNISLFGYHLPNSANNTIDRHKFMFSAQDAREIFESLSLEGDLSNPLLVTKSGDGFTTRRYVRRTFEDLISKRELP